MQFKSIHAPNFYCQNGDMVRLSKPFLPITRHGAEIPSPNSLCASTLRFSFPLQSMEPRVIQLILKDPSLWSVKPYLNSQLPLRPAGSRSDCDDMLHCCHSTGTATAAPSTASCSESANVPASTLSPRDPKRLNNATLMNELLRCESLVHS